MWFLNLTIHWSSIAPCFGWSINTLTPDLTFSFHSRNPHLFAWLYAAHTKCNTGFFYKTCSVGCHPTISRHAGRVAWIIKQTPCPPQEIANIPAMMFSIVVEEEVLGSCVNSVSLNIERSTIVTFFQFVFPQSLSHCSPGIG